MNAYLVEGEDGWSLVDSGMHTDEAEQALRKGLADANVPMRELRRAFITHLHPDHMGLAGTLEREGVEIVMHRPEIANARRDQRARRLARLLQQRRDFAPELPPAEREQFDQHDTRTHGSVGVAEQLRPRLADTLDQIRRPERLLDQHRLHARVQALALLGIEVARGDNDDRNVAPARLLLQGGYNGKLNGSLTAGVILSSLQGRRAYTGAKGLHHVRVPLEDFALGGQKNTQGLPMYIRFHMTSDVGTNAGPTSGWYIDNLVVSNLDPSSCRKDLFWREVLSLREAWMGDWTRNITHLDGHVVQLSRKRGEVVQPNQVEVVPDEGMPVWHQHLENSYGGR